MCGECFYEMGVFNQALDHYTNALQLFVRFPDWMSKLQFAATIQPAGAAREKPSPGAPPAGKPGWVFIKPAC